MCVATYIYIHVYEKIWWGHTNQRSLDSGCFKLFVLSAENMHNNCLAHHPGNELYNMSMLIYMYMYTCICHGTTSNMAHHVHVYMKPGGVSDKLGIFPADES